MTPNSPLDAITYISPVPECCGSVLSRGVIAWASLAFMAVFGAQLLGIYQPWPSTAATRRNRRPMTVYDSR